MPEEYTDEEIEEIRNNANTQTKLKLLIDRVLGLEERLDDGMSEKIARNSSFRKISIILWTGLILLLIGKGFF